MRIILFTGKGGVGKTSVACATSLAIAATGKKTLVMSTDPAHSVADSFGVELSPEPTEVAPNLWAEQIDAQQRLEENWREIQEHAIAVLNWAGLEDVAAEELSVIPGLDELFSLVDVKKHHDDDPYDVLVVDCAPTGETLRLLSLPDVIQWYMERIYPIERRVMGALRPLAQRVVSMPLPDDRVYAAVKRFYERLDGVKRVLNDPETTSVRLVVNPEQMVIAEAQRTYTYLNLFGYRVDAIVANRVLPPVVSDPYFTRWKKLHERHLRTIEESFSPVPILRGYLREQELVGAELLQDFARELYGDSDPSEVMFESEPMSIVKTTEGYTLVLQLPLTAKEDVELSTKNGELFVRVGPYRRTILLPRALANRDVGAATLEQQRLEVKFKERT